MSHRDAVERILRENISHKESQAFPELRDHMVDAITLLHRESLIEELETIWDEFHNNGKEIEENHLLECNRMSNVIADRIKELRGDSNE